MAVDLSFLVADPDFYEPWDTADPGTRFRPVPLPDGWKRLDEGGWTHWGPPELVLPDQGWKVHVASSLANARSVLAIVSSACAELGVPFKHLAGERIFLLAHDKHAARPQSGKFCTVYPPTEECATRVMRRLSADLAGVDGPYVLTDRRFGESTCVSYRYGAFRGRTRVDAEGHHVPTLTGPDGREIDDERRPVFHLPPGISDPFREAKPKAAGKAAGGKVTMHGYTYDTVLRHSNAGGAYRFRTADDTVVFVKEAKAHNGYTADGADAKARLTAEYLALREIHARAPGLCPRPVELFAHWEHTYLVSEFVPGVPLYRWMVTNNPTVLDHSDVAAYPAYHDRCLELLDQLDEQVRTLHELGFVFVDLSPTNVLVDDDDRVRLVDFEAVQPVDDVRRYMGTPGYLPPDPRAVVKRDPRELDRYGLSALALLLVFPAHEAAERHPAVLDHLHANLTELTPVAPRLWHWATRCHERTADTDAVPTPAAVRADPVAALRDLAERTADAVEAMAQPDHPVRVYPTSPLGYQTDTRAPAAGTAGVLHALHRAGRACDPAVLRRLRDESLAAAATSAPGLLYGSAGIAGVLAELGEAGAAETLLAAAAAHPLNAASATLGGGAAGTALGLLAHHRRTGEQRWLDLAAGLLEDVPDGDELTGLLSTTNRSGLVGGRAGVALALYRLHRATGDDRHFARGMRLLREDLTFAVPLPGGGLGFRAAQGDRRVYPYLFAGSAGYAAVLSRFLAHRPDAEFDTPTEFTAAEALARCLRSCSARFTVFPGLFPGLAGLFVTLADAGKRLGRPDLLDAALTSARGLFRYAVPHENGVGWLGEPGQRLSTDLWSGAAGVLLALRYLIDALPDPASSDAVAPPPKERSDRHGGSPALAG